jgi:hypothetical protein
VRQQKPARKNSMQLKLRQAAAFSAPVVLTIALLMAFCGSVRAEEEEGTEAQRTACTPDVFRLCAWHIPDHAAIEKCLRSNMAKLNTKCRQVFEGKLK